MSEQQRYGVLRTTLVAGAAACAHCREADRRTPTNCEYGSISALLRLWLLGFWSASRAVAALSTSPRSELNHFSHRGSRSCVGPPLHPNPSRQLEPASKLRERGAPPAVASHRLGKFNTAPRHRFFRRLILTIRDSSKSPGVFRGFGCAHYTRLGRICKDSQL